MPNRLLVAVNLGAAVLAILSAARAARAVEDAAAFLAALRERNLHELALEYLDVRESSPLVAEEFRQRIPYEQAITLIEYADRTADAGRRAELLQQAEERLGGFAAAHSTSDMGGEARLKLAQVLLERARQDVARADRMASGEAAERDKLLQSARATFEQARTQFQQAEEYYNAARKQFSTNLDPRTQTAEIERRDEYRLQWLTAWFYKARNHYETAKAYPKDSAEFKDLNRKAVQELAELHEKYHTRLVGLTAHLYEGRAYQALGELDKAIGCFEDLVIQPEGPPEFRLLITQAWMGLAECLLEQEKLDEVLARPATWLNGSTKDELRRPEWLALRFLVARAKKRKAESLAADTPLAGKLRREAREEFRLIAREPSPLRRESQEEFASLTNRAENERAASEIQKFDEAYQLAVDAFDDMRALSEQSAAAEDADQGAELKEASHDSGQRAKACFQRALHLAPTADDLDLEQLNLARYYLAWLAYQDEQFDRAAILGEFLAQRYPDSLPARDAAKLAMAAYQQLYQAAREDGARGEQLDVDAERMVQLADHVVRRWPDTDDAGLAQDMLVSFAVREGRFDDAQAILDSLPPERRLQSELRVANGLWGEFLRVRRGAGADGMPSDGTAALGEEARKRLEAAFRQAEQAEEVSSVAATTGLYLAQAHLLDDNYDAASAVLNAEKIGPLTLARGSHEAVSHVEFLMELGKTALQAFALASPPRQDQAVQVMEMLDVALGGTTDGGARLTQIYLGLGLQLRERLDKLTASGRDQEAQQVAAAFEGLLDRLRGRKLASDWTTGLWIANAYHEVGEAIAPAPRPSAAAKGFFEKSLAAYDQLLAVAKKTPGTAPSEKALMAVRKRRADVLRDLGRFSDAMDIYSDLLGENIMMLDVQRDAAYTYQLWGESDVRRFENAIHGGRRVKSTGENRVWGWIKLSSVAAQAARQDPQYRDWYFEARFNAAKARYRSALAVQGDERKDRIYKARNAVRALYQSYPEMGGPDRQQAFEELVVQIQQSLKQPPVGLKEFAAAQ